MTHWIIDLADYYRVPDYVDLSGTLEDVYRAMRALCEGCYSARRSELKLATRRAERLGGHVAPGVNFLRGATVSELRADRVSGKKSAAAVERLREARAEMDEYYGWTRYKFLLAILTGRYGEPTMEWRGRPSIGCVSGFPNSDRLNADIVRATAERPR